MSRFKLIEELELKRVVIKIGSSLLADPAQQNGLNPHTLKMLVSEISALRNQGIAVLLVSSGAVTTGRHIIQKQFGRSPRTEPGLARRQALSAIGQSPLIAALSAAFKAVAIPVAQILITAHDLHQRRSYLNIGHTLHELMELGALPIINENDTVATDELQFGENDLLSAACAALFDAQLLIILTSVDGFLLNGKRIAEIKQITSDLRKAAGGPAGPGSGGMQTKLRAGELCQLSGQSLAILPGRHPSPVSALLAGQDIGTVIHTRGQAVQVRARKKWLLFVQTQGAVCIDDGALEALQNQGSSLLPGGIAAVPADFYAGEVIAILDGQGQIVGRGISNYSSRELRLILEQRSTAAAQKIFRHRDEVIHRDNLVMEIRL
ncbi:MAG: glutamate 5-kinase [Leptospiraceae bacterium]|nr:glutamate 5-kinase [Leptospiraceae bacterium]